MKRKRLMVAGAALAVLAYAAGQPANAQTSVQNGAQAAPSAPASPDSTVVVVTGIRASLQSAQTRKRNASEQIESIVADDIGKLPDANTVEALQRVPGIQVARDRGEGGSIAIRGLTQVETTLNGHEIFTAGGGRSYNLEDMPSEAVASIDVYKTPGADLMEGGIAGLVDLRTRSPFDFKGFEVAGSLRGRYGDLVDKTSPEASLLLSDRWHTQWGDMGLLIDGSYAERAFRTDTPNVGAPSPRTDLIAGTSVNSPNGDYEPLIAGTRHRKAMDAMFQWRPMDGLELYASLDFQKFDSIQGQWGLNNPTAGKTAVPGSVTLFPGTQDEESATFTNIPVTTFGVARDTYDNDLQYAVGGKWTIGHQKISADLNYQESTNDLYYREMDLVANGATATINISNLKEPSYLVSGVDLTKIASYNLGSLTESINHYKGHMAAARIDDVITIDNSWLEDVKIGVRDSSRHTGFVPIRFYQAAKNVNAAPYASIFTTMPYSDFYKNNPGMMHDYLVADLNQLRNNFDGVRNQLGITTAPAVSPLAVFAINEKTDAAYIVGDFAGNWGVPFDGNLGVRAVKTTESVNGNRATYTYNAATNTYTQSGYASVNKTSDYTDILPSGNIRFHLTDQVQARLAMSETMTRPDTGQLSPSLTLVPAQGAGSSGNPDLVPLTAKNIDGTVEWYFSRTGFLTAGLFDQNVKGFIFTTVTPNVVIDGVTYNISQPTNGRTGTVKGLEFGGQTFFDWLPGYWSGFGVQANYTMVDSSTNSVFAGLTTPLPNLSKNSFNLVGLYEKGPWSVRVAYNWRDKFLTGIYSGTGSVGIQPVYEKAYGWLDWSVNYDVTKQITLTLEESNALQTPQYTYFGRATLPNGHTIDDRQFLFGIRYKM